MLNYTHYKMKFEVFDAVVANFLEEYCWETGRGAGGLYHSIYLLIS